MGIVSNYLLYFFHTLHVFYFFFKWLAGSKFKMIRELPPDLAKIAAEELNEKATQTKDDVQHLKEWIAKQPHLKARTGKNIFRNLFLPV